MGCIRDKQDSEWRGQRCRGWETRGLGGGQPGWRTGFCRESWEWSGRDQLGRTSILDHQLDTLSEVLSRSFEPEEEMFGLPR